MTNSRASATQILDNHLATGTESTYTFTPGSPLDLVNKYREIRIIITGKATATLEIRMTIDSITDYDIALLSQDTTTLAGAVAAATAVSSLLATGIIDGAVAFYIDVTMVYNNATDNIQIKSIGTAPHEGMEIRSCEPQGSASTLTSITIVASTSTWIAGTEITTLGILR